ADAHPAADHHHRGARRLPRRLGAEGHRPRRRRAQLEEGPTDGDLARTPGYVWLIDVLRGTSGRRSAGGWSLIDVLRGTSGRRSAGGWSLIDVLRGTSGRRPAGGRRVVRLMDGRRRSSAVILP